MSSKSMKSIIKHVIDYRRRVVLWGERVIKYQSLIAPSLSIAKLNAEAARDHNAVVWLLR
jgi:hypothetical protein